MIGVCITTTPDRLELFNSTYEKWDTMMPEGAILTYVSDEGAGVARAKNLSLSILDSLGVTDYFLIDNDVWPTSKDWWQPYVNHKEPHLMYQFRLPGKPASDMREVYRDDETVSFSHTRGALIYINKTVLETVGGMDTVYKNGFEHPDWTNRIHNAGLTTYRAQDVPNSNKLFYCLDQDGKVESSIKKDPVQQRKNYEYYRKNRLSREYKEYK